MLQFVTIFSVMSIFSAFAIASPEKSATESVAIISSTEKQKQLAVQKRLLLTAVYKFDQLMRASTRVKDSLAGGDAIEKVCLLAGEFRGSATSLEILFYNPEVRAVIGQIDSKFFYTPFSEVYDSVSDTVKDYCLDKVYQTKDTSEYLQRCINSMNSELERIRGGIKSEIDVIESLESITSGR